MVVIRKKKTIDAIDREILRKLYNARRNLTGNQLANKIRLSSSAIAPRLRNLKLQGIIKQMQVNKPRTFTRTFGTQRRKITAPRSIFWGINFKKLRKK